MKLLNVTTVDSLLSCCIYIPAQWPDRAHYVPLTSCYWDWPDCGQLAFLAGVPP